MDFDSFLASPRWEILQIISENPASPIEIAHKLNTTVSYVSQQLRLLEAASLVEKKRTGAFERGKPRTLFSISKEFLYFVSLTKKFSQKKLIHLTDYHKTILKIWLINDSSLHYHIEKFFWKVESFLDELNGIFIDTSKQKPKIIILSESKKLKSKIDALIKDLEEKLDFSIISEDSFKLSDNLQEIYDPKDLNKKLKGGENETTE